MRLDEIVALLKEVDELEAAGRRNGSAPDGEAWLLEGVVTKEICWNLKYAYHQ